MYTSFYGVALRLSPSQQVRTFCRPEEGRRGEGGLREVHLRIFTWRLTFRLLFCFCLWCVCVCKFIVCSSLILILPFISVYLCAGSWFLRVSVTSETIYSISSFLFSSLRLFSSFTQVCNDANRPS